MEAKNTYQTQQRKLLTDYMRRHADRQISIAEMAAALQQEHGIGKSTVYRLAGKLVEEGVLKRFRSEEDKSVLYQYSGDLHCESHLHLKCCVCGKIVHLHCDKMTDLLSHLGVEHGFCVDISKSVLYGRCMDCMALAQVEGEAHEDVR